MTNTFHSRGPAPPPSVAQKTLKYKEAQEHLLRRLGSALVMQWDALPDNLQDLIIDQAAAVEDRDEAPHASSDIEAFIRSAKVVALTKPASPDATTPEAK